MCLSVCLSGWQFNYCLQIPGASFNCLLNVELSQPCSIIGRFKKVGTNVPSKLFVRGAHTGKLGAHINVPSKNVFCTYFIHVIPNWDEFW